MISELRPDYNRLIASITQRARERRRSSHVSSKTWPAKPRCFLTLARVTRKPAAPICLRKHCSTDNLGQLAGARPATRRHSALDTVPLGWSIIWCFCWRWWKTLSQASLKNLPKEFNWVEIWDGNDVWFTSFSSQHLNPSNPSLHLSSMPPIIPLYLSLHESYQHPLTTFQIGPIISNEADWHLYLEVFKDARHC